MGKSIADDNDHDKCEDFFDEWWVPVTISVMAVVAMFIVLCYCMAAKKRRIRELQGELDALRRKMAEPEVICHPPKPPSYSSSDPSAPPPYASMRGAPAGLHAQKF